MSEAVYWNKYLERCIAAREIQSDNEKVLYIQQSGGHSEKGGPFLTHSTGDSVEGKECKYSWTQPFYSVPSHGRNEPPWYAHYLQQQNAGYVKALQQGSGGTVTATATDLTVSPTQDSGGTEVRNKDSGARVQILIFGTRACVFIPLYLSWFLTCESRMTILVPVS